MGTSTEKGKRKRAQYQTKVHGGYLWLKPKGCSETVQSHSELLPVAARELDYFHPPPHRPWLKAAFGMTRFPGTSHSPCIQTKQILEAWGWRPFDQEELAVGGEGTQAEHGYILIHSVLWSLFCADAEPKPPQMKWLATWWRRSSSRTSRASDFLLIYLIFLITCKSSQLSFFPPGIPNCLAFPSHKSNPLTLRLGVSGTCPQNWPILSCLSNLVTSVDQKWS